MDELETLTQSCVLRKWQSQTGPLASNFRFRVVPLEASPGLSAACVHPQAQPAPRLASCCRGPAPIFPGMAPPRPSATCSLLSASLGGCTLTLGISGAQFFLPHPALVSPKAVSLPGVSPEQSIWAIVRRSLVSFLGGQSLSPSAQ